MEAAKRTEARPFWMEMADIRTDDELEAKLREMVHRVEAEGGASELMTAIVVALGEARETLKRRRLESLPASPGERPTPTEIADIIDALHERAGVCGHCGKRTCLQRGSWSTLPNTLKTDDVLAVLKFNEPEPASAGASPESRPDQLANAVTRSAASDGVGAVTRAESDPARAGRSENPPRFASPETAETLLSRIRRWRDDDRAGYDQAITLLCEAEDQIAAPTARGPQIRAQIEKLEWAGSCEHVTGCCAFCFNFPVEGHASDCPLAAILAEREGGAP